MINICEYIDYRKYLSDLLANKRKHGDAYTLRAIHRRLGIKSTGYFSNLLAGRFDLSLELADKIAEMFSLSDDEKVYFKNMILFSRAQTVDEKNHFFELIQLTCQPLVRLLNNESLNLFAKWYYVPLRELLVLKPQLTNSELANLLLPQIQTVDVDSAVDILVRGGFIRKTDAGKWERCDTALTTGNDIDSYFVARFQKEMIELSLRDLTSGESTQHDISGVTLTVSELSMEQIKKEIRVFRKRIMQIAMADKTPERVYRCNIQLFPLSKGRDSE